MITRRRWGRPWWQAALVALAISSLSAAFAATVTDEEFYIEYTVPELWKPTNALSDISSAIIRKAFAGSGGGFIVTSKREDYAFTADEWCNAIVGGLSDDKAIKIESSTTQRMVGDRRAAIVVHTGKGSGMKMGSGSTALKRMIVLIPNGPDVLQFILTAPANSFAAPKAAFEKVLDSIVFSGQAQPQKARPTGKQDPRPKELQSADAPSGATAAPSGVPTDYWQASKSAATRAVVLLAQRGLSVYQSVTDNAAVEVVACDPKGGKLVPVQAAIPVVEGAADAELGWQLNSSRMRAGDVVVLLKSGNRIGWVVPWEMLKEYAVPIAEGSVIVEVKSNAKLKETVLLEALAPYADVKKCFPQ